MVTLGIGPAGTGKTYLAVAAAVAAFREKQVNPHHPHRPPGGGGGAAGLPAGDLQSKVDPYLRPLYDALFDMLGPDTYQKYLEAGQYRGSPPAYMRGRTLDDSFIIPGRGAEHQPGADEDVPDPPWASVPRSSSPATSPRSTCLRIRCPACGRPCGCWKGWRDIAICRLGESDVVRHALVQRIIKAYEVDEDRKGGGKKERRG